jgi:UPF0042 nucleotide-binding protein
MVFSLKDLKIYIVSGLSGSGKSTALEALEDEGFYCVENMPIDLLPKFLELPTKSAIDAAGLAFVMDIRQKGFLSKHAHVFESLKSRGHQLEILFLESDEKTLLQRYSQTRRQHPVTEAKTLIDSIREEKQQLRHFKNAADRVIETTHYNVHELKAVIRSIVKNSQERITTRITVMSFGFKYGSPAYADLVIDVRFLKNPYFIPELKDLNGLTDAIRNFVLKDEQSHIFLDKYIDLLNFLIPLYEMEGKAYLTIAVGCTGGRHRSVVIAEQIFEKIRGIGKQIDISHRDIGK